MSTFPKAYDLVCMMIDNYDYKECMVKINVDGHDLAFFVLPKDVHMLTNLPFEDGSEIKPSDTSNFSLSEADICLLWEKYNVQPQTLSCRSLTIL